MPALGPGAGRGACLPASETLPNHGPFLFHLCPTLPAAPPPQTPASPPVVSCPCSAIPEAVDGVCRAGEAVVRFGLEGGPQDHVRCFPGFRTQSPDVLSFFFCINHACLPPALQGATLDITAEEVPLPGGPTSSIGGKIATLVTFLVPACVTPSATAHARTANGSLAPLPSVPGQHGVFHYPQDGIAALSLHALVEPACDGDYVAGLVTSVYAQEDAQPAPPPGSCPCWPSPQEALQPNALGCEGLKIPVTLETLPAPGEAGVSYQQCIDPANFDFL